MDRGGAYYYVYDGLGSVRALTNSTGTVTDTYAYDAFGNTTHGIGSSPNFNDVLEIAGLGSEQNKQPICWNACT